MMDFELSAKCTVLDKLREAKRVKVCFSEKAIRLKSGISNNPTPLFIINSNEITFYHHNLDQLIIKVRNLSNPIVFTGSIDTVNQFSKVLNAFAVENGKRKEVSFENNLNESKKLCCNNSGSAAGKNFLAHLRNSCCPTKTNDNKSFTAAAAAPDDNDDVDDDDDGVGVDDGGDIINNSDVYDLSPIQKKRRISEGNKENDKPNKREGFWRRTTHRENLSLQFRDRTNPSSLTPPKNKLPTSAAITREPSFSFSLLDSPLSAEFSMNENEDVLSLSDIKENLNVNDHSDAISLDDDYDSVETNPSGFINIGNSCFLNAVLKGIFATPIFRKDVLASTQDSAFIKSLKILASHNDRKHFPSAVKEIWSLTPLEKFTQQDAHEFLAYMIDRLSREDACLVKKNFEIIFEIKFKCRYCEKETFAQDLAFSIPLPVLDCDFNIIDSLDKIFEPEHVLDYKCCDKEGGITLIKRLKTIPRILVLCVMRYSSNPYAFTHSVKLSNRITFSETISLFPDKHLAETFSGPDQCSINSGEQLYKLASVISHIGNNASCGHYVCEVHDLDQDKWYLFDDERVYTTDLKEILQKRTENAYIFFYVHTDCFSA